MQVRPAALVLVPTMVGLNLALGWIVAQLKLPIFLDSVGIILSGILVGPWIAAAVGVATCLVGTLLINSTLWAFSGTGFVIGIVSGLLAKAGFFTKVWKAAIAGVLIGVIAAIPSALVVAKLFGGATASGTDAITVLFRNAGNTLMESVFLKGFASEPIDKTIAALLALYLARSLSRRTLQLFPGAEPRIRA